ncbi:proteasome endopeptidase complex, archaeal, alpha subunit [Candidatus Woesearchaeota archaeon RBG_13_36_6]|nr:MAG: proteasome endopeptidase complex, archaeal, alpha subunit [Candidatus Woesearchaeota archaeon RBG_13_36_6]
MPHQLMGYDRAITMFSPDGRLLQVEYAKKTVRQGSTAIGFACKDGVLLVTDKRIVDKLVVPEAVEKIFQIDDHIIATASGILSDARILVERAQLRAQQNQVTYDTPIDTLSIVKDIANLKQLVTQSGGFRPFGVSLLIAGIDEDGPKVFETDPTGIFFQYWACAIGEGEIEVEEVLHKEYKQDMTVEECLKLAIKALTKFLDKKFDVDRIDAAYVKIKDPKMKRFTKEIISKIHKETKK